MAGQAREIGLATEADIESVAEALGIDIGTVGDLGDLISGADHPFGEKESDRELVVMARGPHRHRDARAIDADRERLLERSPAPIRPLVAWADVKWHAEPPQVQVLLKAAAAGGAFIGLVLGAWLPHGAAAFLTSLVGALFALVGGMQFLLRAIERGDEPVRPFAWLLLWLALSGAGWIFQSWRSESAARRQSACAPESGVENG